MSLTVEVAKMMAGLSVPVFPEPGPAGRNAPYVSWRRVSHTPPEHSLDGTRGFQYVDFIFAAWDPDYDQKETLAEEVISAVEPYSSSAVPHVFYRGRYDVFDDKTEYHGSLLSVTMVTTEE